MLKKIGLATMGLIMFLACFAMPPTTPTKAAETESVGITPADNGGANRQFGSWFVYTKERGSVIEDAVKIINKRSEPVTLNVKALDGAVTSDGGFTVVGETGDNRDFGAWTTLDSELVTVPAKSEVVDRFTVRIPADAEPGDHMGGIVIYQEPEQGKGGMTILTRVAARFYLTIPGKVNRQISITDMSWSINDVPNVGKRLFLSATIENNGNMRFDPQGTATIRNLFFKPVSFSFAYGTTFPKSVIKIPIQWDHRAPIFGRFVAKIKMPYDPDNPAAIATSQLVFWIIPWNYLSYALVLILIIIILRAVWLYFRKLAIKKMPEYISRPGDNLVSVAEKFQVSWKKLAKVNQLKKPYHLKDGERIKIPKIKKS